MKLKTIALIVWRAGVAIMLFLLVSYGGVTNIRIDKVEDTLMRAIYDNYKAGNRNLANTITNAYHIQRLDWRIGKLHELPEAFAVHPDDDHYYLNRIKRGDE